MTEEGVSVLRRPDRRRDRVVMAVLVTRASEGEAEGADLAFFRLIRMAVVLGIVGAGRLGGGFVFQATVSFFRLAVMAVRVVVDAGVAFERAWVRLRDVAIAVLVVLLRLCVGFVTPVPLLVVVGKIKCVV